MAEQTVENGVENQEQAHWVIGKSSGGYWCHLPIISLIPLPGDESYDDFNENGDDTDSGPPPARSGGQGGLGGLSYSDQIALLERRKRLK